MTIFKFSRWRTKFWKVKLFVPNFVCGAFWSLWSRIWSQLCNSNMNSMPDWEFKTASPGWCTKSIWHLEFCKFSRWFMINDLEKSRNQVWIQFVDCQVSFDSPFWKLKNNHDHNWTWKFPESKIWVKIWKINLTFEWPWKSMSDWMLPSFDLLETLKVLSESFFKTTLLKKGITLCQDKWVRSQIYHLENLKIDRVISRCDFSLFSFSRSNRGWYLKN